MDLRGVLDDPARMSHMLHALARTCVRLRELPIPSIAHVRGAAIGGGCGLMVVCDIAFTHPEAKLGYPEVDLGLCPAVVAPWLIRRIGAGRARAMLLSGGTISGADALERGLVDRVVAAGALDTAVAELAVKLAAGGREAMAATKTWLNQLDGSLDRETADRAAALSARVIAGEEAQSSLRRIFGNGA
jgi:methylglutaconyl-CoA hydratase